MVWIIWDLLTYQHIGYKLLIKHTKQVYPFVKVKAISIRAYLQFKIEVILSSVCIPLEPLTTMASPFLSKDLR